MSAEKDIAQQTPLELLVAKALLDRWPGSLLKPNAEGKDLEKDFEVFKRLPIEVKCDYKAKETGNVFLETFNCRQGTPSGLAATKAVYWVHYIPHFYAAFILQPPTALWWLKWKHGAGYKNIRHVHGVGDGNSDGYIISLDGLICIPGVEIWESLLPQTTSV